MGHNWKARLVTISERTGWICHCMEQRLRQNTGHIEKSNQTKQKNQQFCQVGHNIEDCKLVFPGCIFFGINFHQICSRTTEQVGDNLRTGVYMTDHSMEVFDAILRPSTTDKILCQ